MSILPVLIVEKLLGEVLDFLKKGGESLVKDVATKKAIKEAIERAAERFGDEYSDQELAKALTVNTKFHDLPSVQKAIQQVLKHPFDPAPQVKIEKEFALTLPESQKDVAGDAAQSYLEILREELIGIEKLNDKLNLIYSKRTAEASERTAVGVEELVKIQKKSATEKELENAKGSTRTKKAPVKKATARKQKLKTYNLSLNFQKIAKEADFDSPVPVTVKFSDADVDIFDFVNPLTDKDLTELRWYLEQYCYWPSDIDRDRARIVEGNLPKWGKALFNAIFKQSADAMRLFERFSEAQNGEHVLTIDTTEPRVLRLPWELLRDEGGYLFSEQISVRRRMHRIKKSRLKPFKLPVRILMVTCRPEGAGFIDPRSITTSLLDALDSLPEQFEVEFLRPPTLRALDERLRDKNQPQVHIVHFDGHGVYDKNIGLGFLLFEDEKHKKHQVDAEQLGTLLNKSGIPLMVLNACQSAQPDDRNPFASVASRLIESGVGGVVAMNYSVLVETAKRFTAEFYGALARGESTSSAMDSARRRLFSDTKRITFTRPNQEETEILHLQDWFLPALYQQAETLAPFKPDGKLVSISQRYVIPQQEKDERGGFPPAPLHGFHGRARELLDLERAFATRRIVVLHGFGGQGKTALATQTAEWFTRTRLFERAAFVSFENGVGLDFVLSEVGNALVSDNFQIHEGDPVDAIAESLREKSALLVFDNFESVLPGGNAPLLAEELQKLLEAGAKWSAQGASRLLITTRNPNIPHSAFTPGKECLRKELEGLAPSDALELAASILEARSLPRPLRDPLETLLNFLKGHPLSLQLALPQLRDYSAEQLVKQYQKILPNIKVGDAKERNESLEVSLRFSLDRLGEESMEWLARLWIFEGGAMENMLLAITEIPEENWNTLKPQLTSTALIRVEEIPGVNVPFIHLHPTLAPYLQTIGDNESQGTSDSIENQKSEIANRYWQVYYALASQLYKDDTQHPIQARAIALRELPNLKHALKLTLAAGALDKATWFATYINKFLDKFGRWRERDEIAIEVEEVTKSQVVGITPEGFVLEHQRGNRLLQNGQIVVAQQIFQDLLAQLEGDAEYDTRYDQTLTLQSLGRCLKAQGRPSQGEDFYRRAISLAETLEQTENVKKQTAACHVDLADSLRDSGQYEDARQEYEFGLNVMREIDDERDEGVILGQLGTMAQIQGDLNEARKRYLDALSLFQRMGEDEMEAVAWHQLGKIAYDTKDWDEAEMCFKASLNIEEKLGNFSGAAISCSALGSVSEIAGRLDDTEKWYKKAIGLIESREDNKNLALYCRNLAILYLSQNRLDEAEAYAHRALAIIETLDLSSQPWATYSLLAQIAKKRADEDPAHSAGRMEDVRKWRRKEQESRLLFEANSQADTSSPNISEQANKWNNTVAGVVSVCQSGEPDTDLDKFLDEMAGKDDWKNLIVVLHRILSGERGMELFDGLDDVDSAIVRRALRGLLTEGDLPSSQPSSPSGEQSGLTLLQLLELVERAAGGDHELGGKLFPMLQGMARDPNAPSEIQALGDVLVRVMAGVRDPDLSQLPDELASAIRGMLGRLKNN